jgi:hypothetical protein
VTDESTKTEERTEERTEEPDSAEKDERDKAGEEAQAAFQGDKECPECGAPVEDVRMTCPKCGHEYKDEEYTDKEAGSEFLAGSALHESGEEKEGLTGDAEVDAEMEQEGTTGRAKASDGEQT